MNGSIRIRINVRDPQESNNMETLVLCLSLARITDKLQGHLKTTSLVLLSSAGAVYTLLTLVTTQVNNKGSPEDGLPCPPILSWSSLHPSHPRHNSG
jgi:hypothetical protein